MTKTDPTELAYAEFRQLFTAAREPTKRVLVEFYEEDWGKITKVKDVLDLSWKELFHAIAIWLDVFETNPEAQQALINLIRPGEGR